MIFKVIDIISKNYRNIVSKKEHLIGFGLLVLCNLLGGVINFSNQVVMARVLGPKDFGELASSLAIINIVSPFAYFGLAGYWLKLYGADKDFISKWLPISIKYVLISLIIVFSFLLFWANFGSDKKISSNLLAMMSFLILGQIASELGGVKFQIESQYSKMAIWQILPQILRCMGLIFVVKLVGMSNFTLNFAVLVLAGTGAVLFLIFINQIIYLHKKTLHLQYKNESEYTKIIERRKEIKFWDLLAGVWPFGLASIFYVVYYQIDVVILKYLVGAEKSGIYSAAVMVIGSIYILPGVLYQQILMPRLHKWASNNLDRLKYAFGLGNLIMFLTGVLGMIALWVGSGFFLKFIFGGKYNGVENIVYILAIAIPFRFMSSSSGAILQTGSNIRIKLKVTGVAVLINILMNFILIPKFGVDGAAFSTIITESYICLMFYLCAKRILNI
jgi:O-antigen/teichoic acid export membrane protein